MQQFLEIGTIQKPHGIKGELLVTCYADAPEQLLSGKIWLKTGNAAPVPCTPLSVRRHRTRFCVQIKGITDRDTAQTLRQTRILVDTADLPACTKDQLYLYKIVGFDVFVTGMPERLGTLDHVLFNGNNGDQEVWSIRNTDGKEILFPAVPEFVPEINEEARRITINPPPGLLDICLNETLCRNPPEQQR